MIFDVTTAPAPANYTPRVINITWRFGQYAPLALMHGDVVSVSRFALIFACLK